ncbi:MAG: hypothetical protein R3A51_00685 [Nannocystaceae bacterium]|nr:hypothetical protein [Myxococcales bacterium]
MVQRIDARWGRHPRLYAAQDAITFLGRAHAIPRRAVGAAGVGRDLVADIRRVFGNISVESAIFGTFSVATATREDE